MLGVLAMYNQQQEDALSTVHRHGPALEVNRWRPRRNQQEEEAVRAQLAHLLGRAINIEPEETGGTTRRRPTPRPTDAQAMAAATFTEHAVAAAASMTQRSRCLALPTGRHPRGRPQDRKGRAKSDTCMRVDSGRTVLQKVHSMPNLLRMRSC